MIEILRLLITIIIAYLAGKLVAKMKLPSILGWLITGMVLGPHALSLINQEVLDAKWYEVIIPMAALDDIVGCVVFFSTIAIVAGSISTNNSSPFMIILVVLLPLLIGIATGFVTGFILKKQKEKKVSIVILLIAILITSGIGFLFNYVVLSKPVLNFMLIGMAFSATFANMIDEKQLEYIMNGFNPIHSEVSLVFTGIAVSILIGPDIEGARLTQGTIAAAAVINEIIAVIFAKKGFEWAGELEHENATEKTEKQEKEMGKNLFKRFNKS